jgi:galactokinase
MVLSKSQLIDHAVELLKKKMMTTTATSGTKLDMNTEIIISIAPGRVNLIGEHIDYCDGFVMPFALDRMIVIAAVVVVDNETNTDTSNDDNTTRTKVGRFWTDTTTTTTPCDSNSSSRTDTDNDDNDSVGAIIPLGQELIPVTTPAPKWCNYIRGVIHGYYQRNIIPLNSFNAVIVSSIPIGAGLSSSAALECAVATLIEGLCSTGSTNTTPAATAAATSTVVLSKTEKALLCQKAEHDFANVPCGIMDQFASIYGEENKVIMIDCLSTIPTMIPFHENNNLTIIIANTCVHHELSDGEYALRRKHTEDGLRIIGKQSWRDVTIDDVTNVFWDKLGHPINKRSRHVVSEINRTQQAAIALQTKNYKLLGQLMYESHTSLKDDFEVSCSELDCMVSIAQQIGNTNTNTNTNTGGGGGVIGSRMTGGGFGGSTVTLCESQYTTTIIETMKKEYKHCTGIDAEIFSSRPSQGAHLLKMILE